jgi:hypothetical protein
MINEFYQTLENSFRNIFVEQNSRQDIIKITKTIESKKPILNLMESEAGSFSTLFLPFHGGCIYPYNFKKICQKYNVNKNLIRFCKLAGEIESLTVDYAIYEKEPSSKEKLILLSKLKEFLKILPNYEEFKRWLGTL